MSLKTNEKLEWMAHDFLKTQSLKNFNIETLEIHSEVLKKSAWSTKLERFHAVLVPKAKAPAAGWPVVWWLSGFTGNGVKNLNFKGFESNFAEELDHWVEAKKVKPCIVVLVDGWSSWGGSQFINSASMGAMEDHLVTELLPALHAAFPVDRSHKKWTVAGGSSGGFGALHLGSAFPEIFPQVAALAPDSFFEMSLLPEILQSLPMIEKMGGVKAVYEQLQSGQLFRGKNAHTLLNAVAMGLCYASTKNGKDVVWPVDPKTGVVQKEKWKSFLAWDPIVFLAQRRLKVKKLKRVYLAAGTQDQFHLQYGTRQIYEVLKKQRVKVEIHEFEGDHFDISYQRLPLFSWI